MVVYKITNKINGKIYIGQTTSSISVRWSQHVHSALKNKGKGAGRKLSAETISKIAKASAGKNNGMYGRSHSTETRKKIGAVNVGNKYWLGKSHSEEAKKKISRSKDSVKIRILCVETGVIFDSLHEASRVLNICRPYIAGVLSGKYKSAKGLTFRRLEK